MIEHRIPNSVEVIALPRYLMRAWPLAPSWALREAVKKRDIRVNGHKWDGKAMVAGGDMLCLYLPDKYLTGTLPVLYEDGRVLAVEKPPGLPVDVDQMGIGADTVLTRVRRYYPTAQLCHRLDTGTGGVLLLALTEQAGREMRDAFERHEVHKVYHACVKGRPPREGTLISYLRKDPNSALVRAYDKPLPGALQARLRYRLLQERGDQSLLEVQLYTGRTHQVRVQLAHIGHPLIGDDKYGDRALNQRLGIKEPMLWCVQMAYRAMDVLSPAPFDEGEDA